MSDPTLKYCPICGGVAEFRNHPDSQLYFVKCQSCPACSMSFEKKEDAASFWNSPARCSAEDVATLRANLKSEQATTEELRVTISSMGMRLNAALERENGLAKQLNEARSSHALSEKSTVDLLKKTQEAHREITAKLDEVTAERDEKARQITALTAQLERAKAFAGRHNQPTASALNDGEDFQTLARMLAAQFRELESLKASTTNSAQQRANQE